MMFDVENVENDDGISVFFTRKKLTNEKQEIRENSVKIIFNFQFRFCCCCCCCCDLQYVANQPYHHQHHPFIEKELRKKENYLIKKKIP